MTEQNWLGRSIKRGRGGENEKWEKTVANDEALKNTKV